MSRLKTLQEYSAHRMLSGVLTLRQRCTMHIEMWGSAIAAAASTAEASSAAGVAPTAFPDLVGLVELMAEGEATTAMPQPH